MHVILVYNSFVVVALASEGMTRSYQFCCRGLLTKRSLNVARVTCPPSVSSGMFVTWDKHEEGLESLRGCVGTLSPMAISSLRDYTFSRWVNRFREVPHSRAGRSVLLQLSLIHI